MLERLNLAVFQFNLWANEFLNLYCAKYEVGNEENNIQADMRHVYAMHMHFLAKAPIEVIWQFYMTHQTETDKKRWAMHMLRVQEALCVSKGKALSEEHMVLCGTAANPITRGSAEDVTDYMKYYVMHKNYVDTRAYMKKMSNVQKNLHNPGSAEPCAEDNARAEAWWTQGQMAPVGLIDKLLDALEKNENAVDATLSWNGQVLSVRTALNIVNAANRTYSSAPSSAVRARRAVHTSATSIRTSASSRSEVHGKY